MTAALSRNALLLIVLAGGIARFATLGTQGYWFDEAFTVEIIQQGPLQVFEPLRVTELTPPLYYMLAGAWAGVPGDGEIALRSLSAIFGTATIPVVYAAGRELVDRRAGLIGAALTATSPLMIWYAQEARAYALLIFLSSLSFLFFVRALRGRDSYSVWAWAAASALALASHYFAVALIVPEAGWLLARKRNLRPQIVLGTAAIGVVGLALLPLAAAQQGKIDWIAVLDLGDRLVQLPQHFLVGMSSPWEPLAPIAAAAIALTATLGLARARGHELSAIGVPLLIIGIGAGALVAAALVGLDYLISRNLAALWAPFAVALGAALAVRRLRWIGTAAATLSCALGLALAVWTAATPAAGRPDWEPLLAALGSPAHERVIVSTTFTFPLVTYLPEARQAEIGETLAVRELDVITLRPTADYAVGPCWWLAFCGGQNLIGVSPAPEIPDSFELADRGATELFRYRRYRATEPVTLPPAGFGNYILQSPPSDLEAYSPTES